MAQTEIAKPDVARLELGGRWDFEDLTQISRDYIQLYGFSYSLLSSLPTARESEMAYIYGKFPWRGGFSTVNFFSQLFHKIPMPLRPKVERIQYASPGFIELQAILSVCVLVAGIVAAVSQSISLAHKTYRDIQKAAAAHKLTQIDLAKKQIELTQEQIDFCKNASKDLVEIFQLSPEQNALLDQRSQYNPLMKLKILLSVFRRVEPLAEKQAAGMLFVVVPPTTDR